MSKQQRRKGNAKNASSASAHGYLSQGGCTLVGLTPEVNIFEVASNNHLHQLSEIDDETRIVMKKLTKKDCQTREKGLKELLRLINTEQTSVENCYEHFCGLVPQLSTDGSPTVRMLTMKVLALFLIKLKKAATKGLKKIMPMVFFAKSDVTNGVAASASAVIRDGFEADKKLQLIQLFVPLTFEIATKIILETNDLSAPIEYDATEDKDARRSRLETQSLNVFLSYIKEYGPESRIWEEQAKRIFDNQEYIKKVFSGNKESIKVQLLNLCYKFQNNVEVMMSLPPIVPFIQNSLDAQTFTQECTTAWEGINILLPSSIFQAKVSLKKGIYPRILNVVRKKGNHWRVVKHYFLPMIVMLLRELNEMDNDSKTVSSILESFADNLPWSSDSSILAINCWFSTFSDFIKWILCSKNLQMNVSGVIIPMVIKMTEQAMLFSTAEATESIAGLLYWIVENKKLEALDFKMLANLIIEKVIEIGKEKSRLLTDAITASGQHIEFTDLHAHLLSNSEVSDFHVFKNLTHAEPEYFDSTIRKLNNFNFIEDTDQFDMHQAIDVVKFIQKISQSDALQLPKITVKNNHIGRRLLLTADSKVWDAILRNVSVELFQEMINYWHEKRNGKAIAEAVSFLKTKGVNLDTNQAAENVDFLISLLHKMDVSNSSKPEEKKSLVLKLFAALFDSDEEPSQDHYETLKTFLSPEFDSENHFQKLFSSNEETDTERVLDVACRFDKLMDSCQTEEKNAIAETMMISEEDYTSAINKLRFLELDVFASSQVSTLMFEVFSHPIDQLDEFEAIQTIKEFGRIALFSVASQYHHNLHHVFGWQMIGVISTLEKRYCLKPLDNELKNLKDEIEKRVSRSDNIRRLSANHAFSSNFINDFFGYPPEQESSLHSEILRNEEEMKTTMEFICSKTYEPLEYMENIYEATQSGDCCPLFQFDQSNNYHWLANLIFAKKFAQCGKQIFGVDNLEFRDFALCGIVSVLDTSVDILKDSPHAFEENPRLEALTAIYMELYLGLTESVRNGDQSEQTVEEWNEFYAPTINTYFIRMFRCVRKDQQPTPFIRAFLKVIFSLPAFPNDVPSEDATREFVPELSVFKYTAFEESCISHAFSLFSSNVEHIQLIGYAVSKLLTPIMFTTENEKALTAQDDTEVNVSSRPKLSLPVMISKSYPTDHTHPHVGPMLLDLALIPLQDSTLTQEQRVAYCEAIDHFFKNAMNALMLDQPFDFRKSTLVCRIPKLRERAYYLESDPSTGPAFFDKFAAHLLFKSMTLLPAAVRLFYKGIPNCFMPIFQEVVTKYASKLLIEQELAKVSQATFGGEMKVRTVPVTGEIIAEYTIEETKMKLTIELSADYPLSVPNMNLDKAIVKSDRAKKWLMQLNAYLFHQNGAILEGIEMWKRNVDKGVEGVEDCTICMMTIHQQTHQLPKIKCKQCKNKFHSNCLYKWFESSNQSTCPLCRNNFT